MTTITADNIPVEKTYYCIGLDWDNNDSLMVKQITTKISERDYNNFLENGFLFETEEEAKTALAEAKITKK